MAISRSKVKIYIVDNDTAASTLTATDAIDGEIKAYRKSGGEADVESDPVFGGFVDKEKPISQVELEFDIVPNLISTTSADRWSALAYTQDVATGVYTMADTPADKAVYIGASDGTTGKAWGFNNCSVTMLDIEHNADDNQTGTLNLKFSPTDENGVSNFMTVSTTAASALLAVTQLPAWSALDNN